jgi:sarcosine oxidase gamma subunit
MICFQDRCQFVSCLSPDEWRLLKNDPSRATDWHFFK